MLAVPLLLAAVLALEALGLSSGTTGIVLVAILAAIAATVVALRIDLARAGMGAAVAAAFTLTWNGRYVGPLRPGDVLVLLSTSGRSPNVLAAARRGRECGLTTWAVTGRRPNPLAELADEAICVDAPATATVQELHLVAIHLLCEAIDRHVALAELDLAASR